MSTRTESGWSSRGPSIEIDGRADKENRDRPQANFEQVTGGLFDVTRQRAE
jgi:hypothetical protein